MIRRRSAEFVLLQIVTAAGFLGLLIPAGASAQIFDLLAGDSSAMYHYPGADGRIGTGDDVVSSSVTGTGFGQGLGTSTLDILAVNGGTFDPVTGP